MNDWLRFRFTSDNEDTRPIYDRGSSPEGPFWVTGYHEFDGSILVAYVKSIETLMKQWPEAKVLSVDEDQEIIFTSRFPKPDWWVNELL